MNIKIIILTLLMIAGITAVVLTWNFSEPEPKEIIKEMQTKMAKLKTVHSKTTINISGEAEGKEILTISTIHDQDIDNTDTENIKSTGSFDANIDLNIEGMEETSVPLKTETITIKDTSYIKLNALPSEIAIETFFYMTGISFSGFLNQWIKFDQDSLDAAIEKDWPPQMDIYAESPEWQQPKTANQLQEFLASGNFSSIKEVLAEEKINDKPTYHYVLSLEEKEAEDLTLIMKEYLHEVFHPLESEIDQIAGTDINLWIGKKDKLLYKFEFNKSIKPEEGGTITLGIVLEFSNFNQSLNIVPPERFETLDELFNKNAIEYKENAIEYKGSGHSITNDSHIATNMIQIRSSAMIVELKEGTYANVCTDDNIATMIEDINDYAPGSASCFAEEDAYCVTVELNDGDFYCVDSNLNSYSSPSNSCTAENKACK